MELGDTQFITKVLEAVSMIPELLCVGRGEDGRLGELRHSTILDPAVGFVCRVIEVYEVRHHIEGLRCRFNTVFEHNGFKLRT